MKTKEEIINFLDFYISLLDYELKEEVLDLSSWNQYMQYTRTMTEMENLKESFIKFINN